MNKETEELRQRMSRLSDDELMIMLTINPSDYRQVALDLAAEEVLRRRVSSGLPVDESFLLSIENRQDSIYYIKAKQSAKSISDIAWILPVLTLFQFFAQAIPQYHPLDILTQIFGTVPVAIVGGLLILPLGISLFAIREKYLMLYARLEILFGIIYGIYTIGDKNHWGTIRDSGASNLATWTALAASLYIVVRGLDNRNKAVMKRNATREEEEEAREKEEEAKRKIENARHKEEMEKIKERLKQEREQKEHV
jgi:hypothetical protein